MPSPRPFERTPAPLPSPPGAVGPAHLSPSRIRAADPGLLPLRRWVAGCRRTPQGDARTGHARKELGRRCRSGRVPFDILM